MLDCRQNFERRLAAELINQNAAPQNGFALAKLESENSFANVSFNEIAVSESGSAASERRKEFCQQRFGVEFGHRVF